MPRRASQTVLDVVTYIQRALDPTLVYCFACRVGMCGSCAMTVNGVARWTCRTHVDKVAGDDRLEIAPLRNLPVVLLAAHLGGGLRILALEFLPWRDWQKTLAAAAAALTLAMGLVFALAL